MPLHLSIQRGLKKVSIELIKSSTLVDDESEDFKDRHIDINVRDENGDAPIHVGVWGVGGAYAPVTWVPRLAALLQRTGAQGRARVRCDRMVSPSSRALMPSALRKEQKEIVRALLQNPQCDVNAQDHDSNTPLHYVLRTKQHDLIGQWRVVSCAQPCPSLAKFAAGGRAVRNAAPLLKETACLKTLISVTLCIGQNWTWAAFVSVKAQLPIFSTTPAEGCSHGGRPGSDPDTNPPPPPPQEVLNVEEVRTRFAPKAPEFFLHAVGG